MNFFFTDFKCFIRSNYLVRGPNKKLDYFETLKDVILQEIFLYHYYAKYNDFFLVGGPTAYFFAMFLVLSNKS